MKIYLAVPYSHDNIKVKEERFNKVTLLNGKLMNGGNLVYSPITACHPVAMMCKIPGSWEYWEKLDRSFINWCDIVYIYCLEGWKESTGIQAEIKIANELKKPIMYYYDKKEKAT